MGLVSVRLRLLESCLARRCQHHRLAPASFFRRHGLEVSNFSRVVRCTSFLHTCLNQSCLSAVCGNALCEVGERCTDTLCSTGCLSDCPFAVITCPSNAGLPCSGNGSCIMSSGVCDCRVGFSGDDCTQCAVGYWPVSGSPYCVSIPPVSCTDGIMNGNETGVDCGAVCRRDCAENSGGGGPGSSADKQPWVAATIAMIVLTVIATVAVVLVLRFRSRAPRVEIEKSRQPSPLEVTPAKQPPLTLPPPSSHKVEPVLSPAWTDAVDGSITTSKDGVPDRKVERLESPSGSIRGNLSTVERVKLQGGVRLPPIIAKHSSNRNLRQSIAEYGVGDDSVFRTSPLPSPTVVLAAPPVTMRSPLDSPADLESPKRRYRRKSDQIQQPTRVQLQQVPGTPAGSWAPPGSYPSSPAGSPRSANRQMPVEPAPRRLSHVTHGEHSRSFHGPTLPSAPSPSHLRNESRSLTQNYNLDDQEPPAHSSRGRIADQIRRAHGETDANDDLVDRLVDEALLK